MGIFRYVKMTFKEDIKNSLFYMIVLIFSIVMIFNIINIALNKEIIDFRSSEYLSISGLELIIMIVSVMFIIFANLYYMEEKFKEYAVMSISGSTILNICEVIIIRSLIVTFISVFVGCLFGIISSGVAMKGVAALMNIEITNSISKYSIIMTALIMIVELEVVFLVNTGQVYRSNIVELFNRDKRGYIPDIRNHRIPDVVYILIYLLPVICTFIPFSREDKILMIRYTSLVGVFGIQGIIRYVIPNFMKKYRKKQIVVDKKKIISFSNLYNSIESSALVIVVLEISILLSIIIGTQYEFGTLVNSMSLFCYGIIIFIMSLTVIYKFMIQAKERKNSFAQLKLLGYTTSDIKKIIYEEVKEYYTIIILLVLPYIFTITLSSVLDNFISIRVQMIMIIAYIILFVVTGIISYKKYRKSI